jgi:hypothetical protein
MAGIRPPFGQQGCRWDWQSVIVTTAEQYAEFSGSVNRSTYSMDSRNSGKPIKPTKDSIKPAKWGTEAMLITVHSAPFVRHALTIERHPTIRGRYVALVQVVENRRLSAPSGLGSFDAATFALAPGEDAASVTMTLNDSSKPLPSGPMETKLPARKM